MPGSPWGGVQTANDAFDMFVERMNVGIANCLPSILYAVLVRCPSCKAELAQQGLCAHISGMPKIPLNGAHARQAIVKKAFETALVCPACAGQLGAQDVTNEYYAHLAMMTFGALVEQYDGGLAVEQPRSFVYHPPASWEEVLKEDPPGTTVRKLGRSTHPALLMFRVVQDATEKEPHPIFMVSREQAVSTYYGGGPAEVDALGDQFVARGIEPPVQIVVISPGKVPGPMEFNSMEKSWNQLTAGRSVGLVGVYSEPAVVRRIAAFGLAFGVSTSIDEDGNVTVDGKGQKHRFSIRDLCNESVALGSTIDEVLWDHWFCDFEADPEFIFQATGLRPNPPEESEEAEPAPMAASQAPAFRAPTVSATPRAAVPQAYAPRAVAPAATASTAGPPQGPWSVCRTCGAPSQLRRRLYEKDMLKSSGVTEWIETGKQLGLTVALAWGCLNHIEVLGPYAASGWGVAQEQLAMTAHLSVPFDVIQVHRRLVNDKKGRPCVGYVGRHAASLVSDDRWMQAAWAAAGFQPTPLTANSRGEHAIAIAATDGAWYEVGGVSKEMLKLSVQMGLPKSSVASLWTYKAKGVAPAAGRVQILGQV